jgi:hypothetical protein
VTALWWLLGMLVVSAWLARSVRRRLLEDAETDRVLEGIRAARQEFRRVVYVPRARVEAVRAGVDGWALGLRIEAADVIAPDKAYLIDMDKMPALLPDGPLFAVDDDGGAGWHRRYAMQEMWRLEALVRCPDPRAAVIITGI